MSLQKIGAICFACFILSGCGTLLSITDGSQTVYGGVRQDLNYIQQGGLFSVLAVVDLPLSFMLDTLLLPVTLTQ